MTGVLFVGLGGGIGAILRYLISLLPYQGTFPVLTLITNVLGAVMIGYVVDSAEPRQLSENTVKFLKTGLCGGFTTFSTFSLETYSLFMEEEYLQAGLYAGLSVILCLMGIFLGMYLARSSR